jgi:hypothetical protein
VAGLLDMLLGTQANQPANTGNGPDTSMLQAAAPWGNGTNFNTGTPANLLFTAGATAPQQNSFAQLLQTLMGMGVKQPPNSGEQLADPNLNNLPYQPSPEQVARQTALAQTFPASRNVVDLRSVPQFYPQTGMPLQQMGWGIQGALAANPAWPRPAGPSMPMRFGGSQ